jgi:hypothetical protein
VAVLLVALPIAVLLYLLGLPIITRVVEAEQPDSKRWLTRVMRTSMALHLLAVPMQIFVVDHFYGGIADWNRYVAQGTILGDSFRHFHFTLAGANVHSIVGDSSVSIMAGIVFAIFGTNKLAVFFIFSWLAFMGLVLFYRAFSMTFAGANLRRYAILVFFLPSLIFWTADVSKESIMTLALGLIAYGGAKFLSKRKGGLLPIVVGTLMAAYVRPNELALAIAGLVLAVMFMPASPWLQFSGLRRAGLFVVMSGVLALAIFLTFHFLHGKGGSLNLSNIAKNNAGHGSSIPYHPGLKNYWRDVYEVLFDPMPFNAHGTGERIAALENLILIGVILTSFRSLRILIRASFARTYVLMCTLYAVLFLYAFAALGNLGLITRERTLLLPFLLVPLSIPRADRKAGEQPYFWELRRRDRLQQRDQSGPRRAPVVPREHGVRRYARPIVPPRDLRPYGRRPAGASSRRS